MKLNFNIFLLITALFAFIDLKAQVENDSLHQTNNAFKEILFNDDHFLEVLFYKHYNNVLITNLGTYGSSYYFPTTYFTDNQKSVFAPADVDAKLLKLDGFKPFTNLTWINAGRREQILSFHHVQKFGKLAALNFQYKRISAPGIYINQEANTNAFKGAFNFNTHNQLYQVKLIANIDRIRNQENGGLTNINGFETDTFDRKSLYQVNLEKSYYEDKWTNFGIEQRFNFATKKIDSIRTRQIFVGFSNEYITRRRTYYDYDADSPIYDTTYYDSTSTFWLDSIYQKTFVHRIMLGIDNQKMSVNGFYEYHQNEYVQRNGLDTTFNTAYAGLNAGVNFDNASVQGEFKYGLNGYNEGDIQTNIAAEINPSSNYFIQLEAKYHLIEPELKYKNYSSNHFVWDSVNFFKSQTVYLGAKLQLKKYKLTLFANAKLLDKFFYYDSLVVLKQHDFASNNMSVGVEKDYRWWNFYFKTALIYQMTSDEVLLPLPDLVARQVVYYQNRLFKHKVLKLRTGFNVSYTSAYYGYEFMPGLSEFYVQQKKEIGNYPYVDFFISLHLKRAQIFFKWEHLNAGWSGNNYLLTPTTPAHDRSFKFGVSWNMFD